MNSAPSGSGPAVALTARDRIVETAHRLFYGEGIRATGIDRVIAEAQVTKVTFYRHFPSKNHLVLDFLERRHVAWMAWFTEALQRHRPRAAPPVAAIAPALREWFDSPDYRGCAFINAVSEVAAITPGVREMAARHKAEMVAVLSTLLPPGRHRRRDAEALGVAVDGAIVRAQVDGRSDAALSGLAILVRPFAAGPD